MAESRHGSDPADDRPTVLDAELELATGPVRLRLSPGGAIVLDGPDAAAVVAALSGVESGPHRIRVGGRDVTRRGPAGRARAGLVVVGADPVAGDVSVRDHLAAIAGMRPADALLAGAPLLAGRGDEPAGVLSGGERRVLGFLRASAMDPLVVVCDRAGAGLDDEVFAWAGVLVERWRATGVGALVRPSRPEERAWAV